MPLSDAACKAAKSGPKAYKLSDGGGLQLVVMPSGSKLWRLAYRYREKQKSFSMGAYPAVTLAQARLGRDRAKALLMSGKDPVQDRIDVREAANAPGTTFKAIAQEYVDKQRREKLAPITLSKLQWLLSYAYPKLGNGRLQIFKPPTFGQSCLRSTRAGEGNRLAGFDLISGAYFASQPLQGAQTQILPPYSRVRWQSALLSTMPQSLIPKG